MKKLHWRGTTFTGLLLLTLILLGWWSCKKDDAPGNASMKTYMTDAPGNYDSVLIEVLRVEVNFSNDTTSGWHTLPNVQAGIYNLLDFSNGRDTLIAGGEVPAGTISQIRLVLGAHNSVVVDSLKYDLKVPSGMTSGLKLNVHATLEAGKEYEFWIDFDAEKSIVVKGNGNYSLKPVIRVFTRTTSGEIEGKLSSKLERRIEAIKGTDTVGAYSNAEGEFEIGGLAAGTYKLEVLRPDGSGGFVRVQVVASATVEAGKETDVGTVVYVE